MPKKKPKKSRRPGRPRKANKLKTRPVRFYDSDWYLIERAAALKGLPALTFVREKAVAAVKRLVYLSATVFTQTFTSPAVAWSVFTSHCTTICNL